MSRVKENIIERYVHFIILGVVGLAGLALLFLFVVKSPNTVEVRGSNVGPAQIDKDIQSQARMLESKLSSDPEPKGRYEDKYKQFQQMFAMSLKDFEGAYFPVPSAATTSAMAKRSYDMPSLPELDDVEVSYMRTVAHVPLIPVTPEKQYAQVETQPDDLDLVTVQAKIDIAEVADNFRNSFNSMAVEQNWRDSELAKPLFAKVELQRQKKQADGSWSEWTTVPRTKIDPYAELMSFGDKVSELQKGIDVLKLQFQNQDVWLNVLQPASYDIALVGDMWYPPSLYDRYLKEQKELERERLRQERDKDRPTTTRRERPTRETTQRQAPGGMPGMGAPGGMPGMGTPAPTQQKRERPSRRQTEQEKPLKQEKDVETEYQEMIIPQGISVEQLTGEANVWAFDDSAVPGNTYRYRMRLGVLNPVAGLNWYSDDYKEHNDDVVLYTQYSETTDEVIIPDVEYIFPVKGTTKGILVEVAKYDMGTWKKSEFLVEMGDKIGSVVEETIEKELETTGGQNTDGRMIKEIIQVDYSTGAIAKAVKDAEIEVKVGLETKTITSKVLEVEYPDGSIALLPIGERFWPETLKDAYKEVKSALDQEVEILERSGSGGTRRTPGGAPGGMPGMGMPGMGF